MRQAALFRQMEGLGHLLHLFVAHAFRLIAHGTAVDVDFRTLRQHVDLIKGVHDVCAFTEEIGASQVWHFLTDGNWLGDSRHLAYVVVNEVCDVHRDVTSVALGPPVGPEVSGHFGNLLDLLFQGRSVFQYTLHK